MYDRLSVIFTESRNPCWSIRIRLRIATYAKQRFAMSPLLTHPPVRDSHIQVKNCHLYTTQLKEQHLCALTMHVLFSFYPPRRKVSQLLPNCLIKMMQLLICFNIFALINMIMMNRNQKYIVWNWSPIFWDVGKRARNLKKNSGFTNRSNCVHYRDRLTTHGRSIQALIYSLWSCVLIKIGN